jgi:beta-lactamase superfamily II metal-dependent hydrolase
LKRVTPVLVALIALVSAPAFAQANGKLQIHFIDVGQGDGALLVSPRGETVLFDNGALGACERPLRYLREFGVTKIDYQVVSHYHADHIGCTASVLAEFPLTFRSFDRGGEYRSQTFGRYLETVGAKRITAVPGDVVVLDAHSAAPVQITMVALNGNGIFTRNENDLSLVALVKFGDFDAVIGGDLSGFNTSSYRDIETSVAGLVGHVEVYKVHHHCSRYSTNEAWLHITWPRVAVISAGHTNGYGHPTQECLARLHAIGTKTYWTSMGRGAVPDSRMDVIAEGSIVISVEPGADSFTIGPTNGARDRYGLWGFAPAATTTFSGSRRQ